MVNSQTDMVIEAINNVFTNKKYDLTNKNGEVSNTHVELANKNGERTNRDLRSSIYPSRL